VRFGRAAIHAAKFATMGAPEFAAMSTAEFPASHAAKFAAMASPELAPSGAANMAAIFAFTAAHDTTFDATHHVENLKHLDHLFVSVEQTPGEWSPAPEGRLSSAVALTLWTSPSLIA
jgi:D-tyrosyl-tRNA(Tyr) deacylase